MVWGALIGAAGGLAGSIFSGLSGQSNANAANQMQLEIANKNIEMQREFAQHGIRWKVADAMNAGLHPLIGAGAQPQSFAPVSVSSHVPDTSWMGNAGQNIGRALAATMTREDRVDKLMRDTARSLTLNRMGLENELLRSQINAVEQRNQVPPAFPSVRSGMGGQAQGLQTSLGNYQNDPPKVTTTIPGQPADEAGPTRPQTQWGALPDGGLQAFPTGGIQALSDDGLYQAEHYLRNRVGPMITGNNSSYRPTMDVMAHRHPGATGMWFDEARGAWYPLYAGEYSPRPVENVIRYGTPRGGGAGYRIGRYIR